MLDAQQNGWNVGYDLAMALAVIGIGLSGDPVTTKMSIGCDATSRTAATGSLLGQELGIDAHNVYDPLHHADIVLRHPLFHLSAADATLATNRNSKPTPLCPAVTTFSTLLTTLPSTRHCSPKWTKPPAPTLISPTWSNLWASDTMTLKPGIPTSTSAPRPFCFTELPHSYSGSSQIS